MTKKTIINKDIVESWKYRKATAKRELDKIAKSKIFKVGDTFFKKTKDGIFYVATFTGYDYAMDFARSVNYQTNFKAKIFTSNLGSSVEMMISDNKIKKTNK